MQAKLVGGERDFKHLVNLFPSWRNPVGAGITLQLHVSPRVRFTQALKRFSGALEAASALRFIGDRFCPIRTLRARGVNPKHRPFATPLGQGTSRYIERAAVVRHNDGSRPFDPVDDVEGHRFILGVFTAAHRMRSPEAGGRYSLG